MKLRNGALPVAPTALPAQTMAFVMKILGNASVLQVLWEKHVRKVSKYYFHRLLINLLSVVEVGRLLREASNGVALFYSL